MNKQTKQILNLINDRFFFELNKWRDSGEGLSSTQSISHRSRKHEDFFFIKNRNEYDYQKYDLIINNNRYDVDKALFDKVLAEDFVEMHYSQFSETLLSIAFIDRK